jgi:hypothetical protein
MWPFVRRIAGAGETFSWYRDIAEELLTMRGGLRDRKAGRS